MCEMFVIECIRTTVGTLNPGRKSGQNPDSFESLHFIEKVPVSPSLTVSTRSFGPPTDASGRGIGIRIGTPIRGSCFSIPDGIHESFTAKERRLGVRRNVSGGVNVPTDSDSSPQQLKNHEERNGVIPHFDVNQKF